MFVLGMTGPIGHGKTTFADALAGQVTHTCCFESFLIIAEVADALHATLADIPDPDDTNALNGWLSTLPPILRQLMRITCSFDQIKLDEHDIQAHPIEYQKLILHVENLKRKPSLAKTKITHGNKETYRPFLQWLGGYLVQKIDPGIWYKEIVRRVRRAGQEGCELAIVSGLRYPTDAQILREAGGKIVKVYRPGHLQNDTLDPTERERDNIQPDSTIMSNGSVEDINTFAPRFFKDLENNQLKPHYQTQTKGDAT